MSGTRFNKFDNIRVTEDAPEKTNKKKVYDGPIQFKFEHIGDTLENVVLENIETINIQGKPVKRYTVCKPTEDKDYFFLGNADLDSKMRPRFIGRELDIVLKGTTEVPGGTMKVFEIAVG